MHHQPNLPNSTSLLFSSTCTRAASLRIVSVAASLSLVCFSNAQDAVVQPVIVSADRLPDATSKAPFTIAVIDTEELRRAPQLRLDDILRAQVPGFSLFRRNSSRLANPTTQGVTLRNFGPNGAGRTLVLLDGIPINDPFAGYVLWNQVPPASLAQVLVNPGGGAGLFGNGALAGTIFLESARPEQNAATLDASAGNLDTFIVSSAGNLMHERVTLSLFAESFSTGGHPVVQADQRGPVDNAASSDSRVAQLGTELRLTGTSSLRFVARGFDEQRGNGTIYTRNETTGGDISALLATQFPDAGAELRLSGYGQRRKYRSTFSSVNAKRDLETPASDQYDVPANAAGGSAVWSMLAGSEHRLTLGTDYRSVEGETNEAFRWNGNEFTRQRSAGGQQAFFGAFVEDTWLVSPTTTVVGGARIDHWQLFDGFRREFDVERGSTIGDLRFNDRDGYSVNGRLGARVELAGDLSVRAAGYTGFRVPTLNELYRPFRVGNDVTEANAELEPERLLGGEVAMEWRPITALGLTSTAFFNRLQNAVGNITIGIGPGTFAPGGFIPAGGVLRQRQNIDLVLAPGFDLACELQMASALFVKASYLFTQPTIDKAADPALRGKLLAQTPQHSITAAAEWRPAANWLVTTQLRYTGEQFEDDQNSRELAAFTSVDAAIFYDFSENISAGLKVENLFGAEIETGKSAAGLVNIGTPRTVTLQLRSGL